MPISLYVLLTGERGPIRSGPDSASLTVAIQLVLCRDHSIVSISISCLFLRPFFLYSTQRCDVPQFRISISFYAYSYIIQKVHFIGVHMNTPPFQFYVFLYFSFIISVFVPIPFVCILSGVTFINISAFSPFNNGSFHILCLCWFAPKWHVRSI